MLLTSMIYLSTQEFRMFFAGAKRVYKQKEAARPINSFSLYGGLIGEALRINIKIKLVT